MNMGMKKLSIVLLFTALLAASPVRADSATVTAISQQLVCQCGCYMVLANCSHGECSSREAMTTLIEEKLAQGQSGEQIVQFFVSEYGEQVLSAPTKRGFNLVAWVLPFVAILTGGVVVLVVLKKWAWRGRVYPAEAEQAKEGDEKYRQQLERELAGFAEKGFR